MKSNKKPLFILFPAFILFAASGLVMWLWNTILPEIIGVKELTYWKAMGLLVLCKILFGGFHGKWGKHKNWCDSDTQNPSSCFGGNSTEREKFRNEFKERMRDKFCSK